jgi:hypothetical protein
MEPWLNNESEWHPDKKGKSITLANFIVNKKN